MAQSSVRSGNDIFEQQLKQRKRGSKWRWLGWSVLTLVAGTTAFATLTPQGRDAAGLLTKYAPAVLSARQDPDLLFTNVGGDHVNILLIGRDEDWKPKNVYDPKTKTYRPFRAHDENAAARSDTMIVLSLDKTRKTIRMISLPRDAMVNLPTNPEGVGRAKLNAAHSHGGPAMLIRTLHDELGLTIHRHAVMKFSGFKKLIDQVGGVDVDVIGALKKDRRTGKEYRGNIDYKDEWGMWEVHLKPGMQHLDGEQAHGYVRFRIDREGDPGRIRRQQQVMRALAKKLMTAPITRMAPLINEVRQQFITDLDDNELAATAFFAKNVGDPSKIQPLTLFASYAGDGSSLILNRPKNEKLLTAIFGPTFDARNFLVRSPETKRDDVGPANNASPEALAVLREAGIIDGEGNLLRSADRDVPVRVEDTSDEYSGNTPAAQRARRRRSRLASANETTAASTAGETRRPRKTRRRSTRNSDTDADVARHINGEAGEETPAAAGPASEPGASRDGGSSPVPEPESHGAGTGEGTEAGEGSTSPAPE